MALNLFCNAPREFFIPTLADSPALLAAARARSRDSFVGGGMGTLSCEAFLASGCGWRLRSLFPWMAEIIGLICYFQLLELVPNHSQYKRRTYIFLPYYNHQAPAPFWQYLRQIP
jgi:hypothetical protein